MFGGHGFYSEGRFFALDWKGQLFLKAVAADAAEFQGLGWERFVPFPDRPVKRHAGLHSGLHSGFHYWGVPEDVLADADRLRPHVLGAARAAAEAAQQPASTRRMRREREARRLRNLGPVSRRWLDAVGVRSRADLEALGAATAYERVRAAGFRPSLNLLWALEGALMDLHWSRVPQAVKAALLERVEARAVSEPGREARRARR